MFREYTITVLMKYALCQRYFSFFGRYGLVKNAKVKCWGWLVTVFLQRFFINEFMHLTYHLFNVISNILWLV
jgi:hypothetical protein